jgi:cell division protein FtsZ
MTFQFEQEQRHGACIKVIGVGGAGCNAVNTMIASKLDSVQFIVANTDSQALDNSRSMHKIQLGQGLTKGLGAGANPEIGKNAALENIERIQKTIEGADMVFIAAGMGGGTGTGAAAVIAEAAKAMGALTVGVVTKPFRFEGKVRARIAEEGLEQLKDQVDSLIVIPNEKLFSVAEKKTTLIEGFKMADEVLLHAIKSISDLINVPGLVNLDFADVKTIMGDMGMAFMGIGVHNGEHRAVEAARRAITNPLLDDVSIRGARGMLINITGSSTLTLNDLADATDVIREEADDDANIIFGASIDDSMAEKIQITVIATGFQSQAAQRGAGQMRLVHDNTAPAPAAAAPQPPHARPAPVQEAIARERAQDNKSPATVIKIGTIISEFADDGEYDIPTFVRRQQSF